MTDLQKARTRQIISSVIKVIFTLIFLFPFWVLITTSFKTQTETMANSYSLFPKTWTLAGYKYFLVDLNLNIWLYLKNTIVVTVSVIILQLIVAIPAGYAFAKHEFYFKGSFFAIVLSSLMMPSQVTFITTYMVMAKAKLINTLWPQILPFGAYAFGIFLLRQNFKQVSNEIIESARLDGASEMKLLASILVPMMKATLVTLALFSFVSHWNSYFWPLVITQSDKVRPLSIFVKQVSTMTPDGEGVRWNAVMAANLVFIAPIMIVYFIANKNIVKTYGYKGVK